MDETVQELTPVSAFVEAMSALEPDGNNLYAVTVDDSGIPHKRPVDIVGTATKIAEGISVFVDTLFNTANVTAWENMIYVTKGMTTGDSEDSSGAVGVLSVVIDPISNFVNALCLIGGERGEAGTLAIPIYDSNGKLVNTHVIDLEFTAETIAKSISVFLRTLFSQENQTVWKSLMYGYDTAGNLGTVKNEDLKESIGVFAAVIDPIVSFMDVITKFGGTPEKFVIYDGKKSRTINLTETATSIGEVIKVFVTRMKTAFESITEFNDDQRRDVTNFATSIGSILENFAKVGDTDKDKIDKASLVIDTYFNTVEKISEKLKIEVPEKEKINNIDNMIKRGVSMFKVFEGIDFDTALKQAQANGFAEANPSADIDGIDAQRKISILSTIANDGAYIAPDQISAEGISAITNDDFEFASSIGCDIKLIALYEAGEDKPVVYVAPTLVAKSNLLFNVSGVFNAIMVDGNSLGQAMFYGQGAGTLPTASAVCGDILEAAMSNPTENRSWTEESVAITPYDEIAADIVVRADVPAKVISAAEGYECEVLSDEAIRVKGIRHKDIASLVSETGAKSWMHYLK